MVSLLQLVLINAFILSKGKIMFYWEEREIEKRTLRVV